MLVFGILAMAMGCSPQTRERPALPTAMAGVPSNGAVAPTRQVRNSDLNGPTSTPAPWATALPTPLPPPAPLIPHEIVYSNQCLTCHRPHSQALPSDHTRRQETTCLGCHRLDEGFLPTPVPMGHALDGREACLMCHLQGKNGAPAVPGDHAGRLNDTCLNCHKPKQ
jgi:predicted CXXCH cytochrome family protein